MSNVSASLTASNPVRPIADVYAAGASALLWCVIAALAVTGRSRVGLIEVLFLLGPLVHVPFGFRIVRALIGESSPLGRVAHTLLPVAAILAAVSFGPERGALAGALAAFWPLVCGLAGLDGLWQLARRGARTVESAFLAAAFLFLTVGGVWLVLSRLGVTPQPLSAQIVLLASVHFHFTGFALPVFAAATCRASRLWGQPSTERRRLVFPLLAAGIISGPLFLAAGNLLIVPVLKLIGALLLTAMSFGLMATLLAVVPWVSSRSARALLRTAAISLGVGMTLVGVYTVGEYTGRFWLIVPDMARFHGTVNALGFALCGLVGWTLAAGQLQRGASIGGPSGMDTGNV